MSVLTRTTQERILKLQEITSSSLTHFMDLVEYHFGTTRKTEIEQVIDVSGFASPEDPYEKKFNDYLWNYSAGGSESPVSILRGQPIGLAGLTYANPVS